MRSGWTTWALPTRGGPASAIDQYPHALHIACIAYCMPFYTDAWHRGRTAAIFHATMKYDMQCTTQYMRPP